MSVLYNQVIANYDDSIQPTGQINWGSTGGLIPIPVPHVVMKKLHHELSLVITGPDGTDVTRCLQDAAFVGLMAGVVAAYATGGGAVAAAEAAATTTLEACLGAACSADFNDNNQWITWNT